jgi:hypothetical protein
MVHLVVHHEGKRSFDNGGAELYGSLCPPLSYGFTATVHTRYPC